MTTQDALFPMTQVDIAQAFLNHFEDECEKRLKAVLSANDKLLDAQKLRDMAEEELRRAQNSGGSKSILQAAANIVNSGALDSEGMTVTASVTPTVDPGTGEVASVIPFVDAIFPGDDHPTTVAVGPLTRFGELAADYLASLPADDPRREDDFKDYRVFSADNGDEMDPSVTIAAVDYGHAFVVERQEG